MRPRIGITFGDPAGIGPEIVKAALHRTHWQADFRIIGDTRDARPGNPTPETARSALAAMEDGARLANSGEIDALVTGPIHKARMAEIGFQFPGQTEFFAARSNTRNYAMLLTAGAITVALVTRHIPLREVPDALTTAEIVRVSRLLAHFMDRRSTGKLSRIAIAGLNPHAGEQGNIGREEIDTITPAVRQLQSASASQTALFEGPISPDTLFFHLVRGKWDAAVCMYHDQGLIPLKLLGFDEGVNVTLGLPYARTSPDHGTAFDIAGKQLARPDSMIAALGLAIELTHRSDEA